MSLLCCGCSSTFEKKYEKQALYFDTVISISFYAGSNGNELMEQCIKICEEIENRFSRTKEGSEVYQINHRTENCLEISDEVAELIAVGLDYYEKSGGKFDITVAPLSDLWDFKSEDARVPTEEAVRETVHHVEAESLQLEGNTLTFADSGTMIDLGALVKGYAADQIREYLSANGVKSGMINLGGNVLTIGSRPGNQPWRIGIQKPFSATGEVAAVVEVENQTVVSSGIYQRYFEQDGIIYHHILDPDSGYPIQNKIQGVTIVCESSLMGDALSTTCLAVGLEEAQRLIDSMEGVEALFILEDGEIIYTDDSLKT